MCVAILAPGYHPIRAGQRHHCEQSHAALRQQIQILSRRPSWQEATALRAPVLPARCSEIGQTMCASVPVHRKECQPAVLKIRGDPDGQKPIGFTSSLSKHGSPRPMGIPDTWPMTVPPIESCSDLTTRMSDAILHAVGACGQRTGTAITCNHLHHDG